MSYKFLVIRRDNIGDLVCTIPLIRLLRKKFPDARIDALVNSYNMPVLTGNKDLNHVFAYTKAKHRDGSSLIAIYWEKIKLIYELRKTAYDYLILATPAFSEHNLSLAHWISPKSIIGFVPEDKETKEIEHAIFLDGKKRHEVENVCRLLEPLGIKERLPQLSITVDLSIQGGLIDKLKISPENLNKQAFVAIHISARKVQQRWPAEKYSELIKAIHQKWNCAFLLFWSPGAENNPMHPGDDGKAQQIIAETAGLPVFPCVTEKLETLIAGLSICRAMVCSDGGAMHLGAGLGLPMVCFFGNSDADIWHPWGIPYELLQKDSRDVNDITVEEAFIAFERLQNKAKF